MSPHDHAEHEFQEIVLAPAKPAQPLPVKDLRWTCDPKALPFASTADIEPLIGVIGQDSAVEALRFGLEIHAPGQNVYVRGLSGTGRMTLVRGLLEETRLECPEASDRCYVNNFASPDRPRLITLPRGKARSFQRRIDEMVDFIRDRLEPTLTSEPMQVRRAALEQATQKEIERITQPFEETVKQAGLALVSIPSEPVAQAALFPTVEGRPVPPEEWEQLQSDGAVTKEHAEQIKEKHDAFLPQLRAVLRQVNEVRRRHVEAMNGLAERTIRSVLVEYVESISAEYSQPEVKAFLDEAVDEVVTLRLRGVSFDEEQARRFGVNVLLCRREGHACPIVVENTPTIGNLLGSIDQRFDMRERGRSDHMMIRAGAILRADGGYLILDALDVLREPGAWKVLVRTLRTGRLEIMPPEMVFPWWTPGLKPDPIDVNVKVVLLGGYDTYYLLDGYDPDFPHLFKVLADFDSAIPRDDRAMAQYGGVLARIVHDEGLVHFDRGGVAALIEHGARIAGRGVHLTTRFGRLADIAREASFIARKEGKKQAGAAEVKDAILRSKRRASLPSKRYRELLAGGKIRASVTGAVVGQVNGLAVIHAGPLTYGFPTRITATIGPGTAGVINIDREADLSGAIHTKGFYILGGLLRHLLRTEHPLAFHASIAFEQSYGGIDGDSASAAEICCLLSALTDVPLRQDLAITGAIDQMGNILPIGAVNEKAEGFFDTCNDLGLTGTQGVIVPETNADDLMLREDVVEACRNGRFHVYAVRDVRAALEILTGLKAGEPDVQGIYPDDSLLSVAAAKAFEYWIKATRSVSDFLAPPEPDAEMPEGGDESNEAS
ncbi:MAG: AAA family ATPase [Phycisphaerae bacterium]|nr:AAA family ATPase [Phycisphaerae bacterium]